MTVVSGQSGGCVDIPIRRKAMEMLVKELLTILMESHPVKMMDSKKIDVQFSQNGLLLNTTKIMLAKNKILFRLWIN